MALKNCGYCEYFMYAEEVETSYVKGDIGYCRLHPPKYIDFNIDEDIELYKATHAFPVVNHTNWCGQFKKATS